MPICPKCHRLCKTAQGLNGHMRFRHQTTVPKQELAVYARDRLEKAEDENAKLREEIARLQRQRQDRETFYDKMMKEQRTELEKAQEHRHELERAAALKQHEEHIRSERVRVEEEAMAVLRKQIEYLRKIVEQLLSRKTCDSGKSLLENDKQGIDDKKAGESISDLLPPLPHPLHPISSLKEIERWLFGN